MSLAKILEILAKEKRSLSDLSQRYRHMRCIKQKNTCSNEKKERVMNLVVEQVKGTKT